jgi:hypothetical protein
MSEELRCIRCRRIVEACACCDRTMCPNPLCYADLILIVRQSLPPLHTHGG